MRTVPNRVSHLQPIGETLPERSFLWKVMKNEIMDRDDKWHRATEGDVKVGGEEEIDICCFDDTREMRLFAKGVVRIAYSF